MKCPQCNKDALEYLKFDNWIKVVNCFHFLNLQGLITDELLCDMSDAMMSFKVFAEKEDDDESNNTDDTLPVEQIRTNRRIEDQQSDILS